MARLTVPISLQLSEIVFNIQNLTHLKGEAVEGDANFSQVSDVQANMDSRNLNQVLRSITSAANILKTEMSEFLPDTPDFSADDIQQDYDETYTLTYTLSMPTNYDSSTKDDIATSAHDYIVNFAVSQWFIIKLPDQAAAYAQLAQSNLVALRRAIYKRRAPIRPYVAGGASIVLTPKVITATVDSENDQVFEVSIRVTAKGVSIPVQTNTTEQEDTTEGDGYFSVTTINGNAATIDTEFQSSGDTATSGLEIKYMRTAYVVIIKFILTAGYSVNMAIPVVVSYDGNTYKQVIHFLTSE